MKENDDLYLFLETLDRNELNEEQQILLSSFGGLGDITATGNNFLAGCTTNNCNGGNCGNCISGCGGSK